MVATEGDYFLIGAGEDFVTPNAAGKAVLAAIHKYDPGHYAGIPNDNEIWAWEGAELMIQAMLNAAPTAQSSVRAIKRRSSRSIAAPLGTTG